MDRKLVWWEFAALRGTKSQSMMSKRRNKTAAYGAHINFMNLNNENSALDVTHALAMDRQDSLDATPGVCVWGEVGQQR